MATSARASSVAMSSREAWSDARARFRSPSSSAMRVDTLCASARILAVTSEAGVANRPPDLALRGFGVAAVERDAGGDEAEVRAALGRHARAESASPEQDGVLGMLEQPQLAPKLREVAHDVSHREPISEPPRQLQRALVEPDRLQVIVPPRRDDGEVVEREGGRAEVADSLALDANLLEDASGLVESASRQEGDAPVEPGTELGGRVAAGRRRQRVLGKVPIGRVPLRLGEEDLAERVARLQDRRRGRRDGALRWPAPRSRRVLRSPCRP